MNTLFTLSDYWPMVAAVALENSSVSHCDDKFISCNYSGGTVMWRKPGESNKFFVEIAGQVGSVMEFNDIVDMFTGKDN